METVLIKGKTGRKKKNWVFANNGITKRISTKSLLWIWNWT